MSQPLLPRALVHGVTSHEVGDELVVHVAATAQFHRLSPPAAELWRRCDGRTSRRSAQRRLQLEDRELDALLAELAVTGLLQPADGLARRQLLGRTGVVVGGALITTVVAPQTWAAASGEPPNPDTLPPTNPTPGSFAGFQTVGPAAYLVVAVGASGGGGQPGTTLPLGSTPAGGRGGAGAAIRARIVVPAGTTLTVARGAGGGAGSATAGGAGGGAYLVGNGGAGGLGAGGGGGLSGLYANGVPLLLAGGGAGGAALAGGPNEGDGSGGSVTSTAGGGQDGGDGSAGGGGGGGSTGGSGGIAATDAGLGGASFLPAGPVQGVTVTITSQVAGATLQTAPGSPGAAGILTLTYDGPA